MPATSASAVAACPNCRSAFPATLCNTPAPIRCPACDATVWIEIYPACLRPVAAGTAAEPILEEGVSSCFYHEGKKAVTHCDACGRFLCALCDLDVGDRHVCAQCLQSGSRKAAVPPLDSSRVLYDGMAMMLALVSFLPGLHLMTAPAAVGLGIFALFKPKSIVRRTHARAILAIILGTILGVGYTVLLFTAD